MLLLISLMDEDHQCSPQLLPGLDIFLWKTSSALEIPNGKSPYVCDHQSGCYVSSPKATCCGEQETQDHTNLSHVIHDNQTNLCVLFHRQLLLF